MRVRQLITELIRRRVFRAASIYVVAAWVAVQVASLLFPAIDVPESALRFVWLTVAALFPLVIAFAWMYDITLDGVKRTPPAGPGDVFDPSLRRLDLVLLAALSVVSIAIVMQFALRIAPEIDDYSIAVLPLDDLSGDPDEQYFASGMQASIISGLSRISRLRVTSKASTQQYRDVSPPLAQIAAQLGVARIVEGTVLRDDNVVSIAIRLLNARSGDLVTLAADGEVTIPQQTGKPVTAQQQGVVAVLVADAATGTLTIQVDDVSRMDPSQPILVKSRDSEAQEVLYIASVQGTTVTLRVSLTSSFQAQDLIIQGDRAAAAAAAGTAAPGTAGATGRLSTGALVAIFSGAAGAAGAIVYAVTKGEDEPASPIRP